MKRSILILLAVCVVVVVVWAVTRDAQAPELAETKQATYVHNLIRVTSPIPQTSVSSPLRVTGEARGTWFFEATFPVVLVDWDGRIIAESYATAQDDPTSPFELRGAGWMTEDFVPFEATLKFETPETYDRGALILQRSNPSGLPENDDAFEFPITFKQ